MDSESLLYYKEAKDGQILEYSGPVSSRGVDVKSVKGVVVDDANAVLSGNWQQSGAAKTFLGDGYRHDGKAQDGQATATFNANLPKPGRYVVMLACPPNNNRASNAAIEIRHAGGNAKVEVNMRTSKPSDGVDWIELGTYEFEEDGSVVVSNKGANGYVVVDGVRWVPVKN